VGLSRIPAYAREETMVVGSNAQLEHPDKDLIYDAPIDCVVEGTSHPVTILANECCLNLE
jgi:hypothetical protein